MVFSKYYEGIYILFKTGLRISKFVGLTMNDLDFEEEQLMLIISYSIEVIWYILLKKQKQQMEQECFQ